MGCFCESRGLWGVGALVMVFNGREALSLLFFVRWACACMCGWGAGLGWAFFLFWLVAFYCGGGCFFCCWTAFIWVWRFLVFCWLVCRRWLFASSLACVARVGRGVVRCVLRWVCSVVLLCCAPFAPRGALFWRCVHVQVQMQHVMLHCCAVVLAGRSVAL